MLLDYTEIQTVKLYNEFDSVVLSYDRNGSFEQQSLEFFKNSLKENEVCLDIGSYTGLYAILAAKHGCNVFAFEPIKKHCDRIRKNVELNNVKLNIVNSAILDEDVSTKRMYFTNKSIMNSAARFEKSNFEFEDVSVVNRIDITNKICSIKIDVENSEVSVLSVLMHLIERDQPNMVIEALSTKQEDQIKQKLSHLNYTFECVDKYNLIAYIKY